MIAFVWTITILMILSAGASLGNDEPPDGGKLFGLLLNGVLAAWGAYLLAHA